MNPPRIVEQAFEPRFCRWLLAQARASLAKDGTDGFRPVKGRWQDFLLEGSETSILSFHVYGIPRDFILAGLRKSGCVSEGEHSVVLHAGPAGSCINWHTDTGHSRAATIYLNEIWEADWGGQFVYRFDDDEEPRSITPRFNTAVCIETPLKHRTLRVSEEAGEMRFSLQVFTARPA